MDLIMFCKKCGAELAPDAAFCEKCGTPVAAPAPADVPPAPPVNEPVQAPAADPAAANPAASAADAGTSANPAAPAGDPWAPANTTAPTGAPVNPPDPAAPNGFAQAIPMTPAPAKKSKRGLIIGIVIAVVVILIIILAAVGLSGGGGGKMEDQLEGTWVVVIPSADGDSNKDVGVSYTYDADGSFTISAFVGDMTLTSEYGTYEITDDSVVATKENGDEVVCTYEFEGGTLTMYAPNGQEMTKSE